MKKKDGKVLNRRRAVPAHLFPDPCPFRKCTCCAQTLPLTTSPHWVFRVHFFVSNDRLICQHFIGTHIVCFIPGIYLSFCLSPEGIARKECAAVCSPTLVSSSESSGNVAPTCFPGPVYFCLSSCISCLHVNEFKNKMVRFLAPGDERQQLKVVGSGLWACCTWVKGSCTWVVTRQSYFDLKTTRIPPKFPFFEKCVKAWHLLRLSGTKIAKNRLEALNSANPTPDLPPFILGFEIFRYLLGRNIHTKVQCANYNQDRMRFALFRILKKCFGLPTSEPI